MNTYLGYKCKYAKNALIPQKRLNFGELGFKNIKGKAMLWGMALPY